jgi:CheY-like chemotaxis protein
MVTGQLPMEEAESKDMLRKMLKRSFGAIKPINEHRYSPSEEICRIIEKMMKIDLKARYQNMDDVVSDLDRYQAILAQSGADSQTPAQSATQPDFVDEVFDMSARDETAAMSAANKDDLQPFEVKALVAKQVLCVEAQTEIQDALRKSLTNWGYRALLVADAERAAERFRESPVDAVIFDTDGQDAESIEAFLDMHEKAHEEGQQLLALVLLAHKQASLREKLPKDDKLIVLAKPIKMKHVQAALAQLLPKE